MLKRAVRKSLEGLAGRAELQPFLEKLHRFCLAGMNIGGGAGVQGSGEVLVIKYLAQYIDEGMIPIVFDVGANTGDYSSEVLSAFGKDVQLFCFEPSKAAFRKLVRGLDSYENAHAYRLGFGERNRIATLYSDHEGSGLGSLFARRLDHFGIEMKCAEEIQLRRLDDFCTESGIGHIHLLKLDVEGNELGVLRGSRELIDSQTIDLIQFEFGGCNIDSRTYFQDFFYLLNPNYRIHRILRNGLMPIEKYRETYEIFITTNFLAVSRGM